MSLENLNWIEKELLNSVEKSGGDLYDAISDFLELNPKIDPESIIFSEAFKARLSVDLRKRKLLKLSKTEKESEDRSKETNQLEV